MYKFLPVLFALAITGCTDSTTRFNYDHVRSIMDSFEKGQLYSDVIPKLETIVGQRQETWNLCTEEFEFNPTSCVKGYSLISVVALPKYQWWLKEGTGQLYFTFNNELKLIASHFEIYYPRYHQ
jgi:hypothetical protein